MARGKKQDGEHREQDRGDALKLTFGSIALLVRFESMAGFSWDRVEEARLRWVWGR